MAGSTPIYGFPYPQSTDLVADYPTLGQELATDVETVISGLGSGLNIITPTSIANSGGTATRTNGNVAFTGVNSVSLNGCFTSTYANYRVVIATTGTTASASYGYARFRASGNDTSSNYSFGGYNDNTGGAGRMLSTSQSAAIIGLVGDVNSSVVFDVITPQLAFRTHWLANSSGWGSSSGGSLTVNGVQYSDTQFDGITIYPSSGTLTGNIRVYGYKNS